MSGFNKVILSGNLTADAERVATKGGTELATFTIAHNEKWKDKEKVSFIDCKAFGKTADLAVQYFTKGKYVGVEGRIDQERWKAKDGKNRSSLKVLVDRIVFFPRQKADDSAPEADTWDDEAMNEDFGF